MALPVLVFSLSYPRRRRAVSGVSTPMHVWIDVFVLVLACLLLIANATGFAVAPGGAPYALAMTTVLFLAGWAYLEALDTLLGHPSVG
jgi:hypothetical protein